MEINIHTVDKIVVSEKDYIDYFLTHNYNENMFNSDGTINKNYNSFKKTGLIAKIFDEHWNETYQNNKDLIDKYRCNATTEVEKIINCYNKNLGCSVYECPDCNEIVFVGHTCNLDSVHLVVISINYKELKTFYLLLTIVSIDK